MDTDEQPAHFAWDLLDAAKQVAVTQVADGRATSETKALDTEAQRPALTQDTSPIVRHQPEVAAPSIIQPEAETGELLNPRLQPEPISETAPESAHQPEPDSAIPPVSGPPPATAAMIRTEAPAEKEEPSSTQFQPVAEGLQSNARRPNSASATMWQPPSPIRGDGDIPKLRWDDVGKATEPGQYKSRYGLIHVRADEIRIWKTYPNAAFAVMQPSPHSDQNVSRLGSFDVGHLAKLER